MGKAPVVLVVEDEGLLLFATADDLRRDGCEVYEARDAEQALTHLRVHEEITLLFTDIDLRKAMDGLQFSRLVSQRWPTIKIIITSGMPEPDLANIPHGGVFLPKPYQISKLSSTIRAMHNGG